MNRPYTDLRRQPRVDLAAAVPLPQPLTLYFESSNLCNLRCPFCPQSLPDYHKRAGYHQHMDFHLYERLVEEVQSTWGKLKSLKLALIGEPLLNPRLPEMVALAASAGIAERIEITSNGTLPLIPLLDRGLDYLQVSVYPHSPPETLANVRALMDERQRRGLDKPIVYPRVLASTLADVERFQNAWQGLGDELGVDWVRSWGTELVSASYRENCAEQYPKTVCPHPFYALAIKSDGTVQPCCAAWGHRLIVGNVRFESLKHIWEGQNLRYVRLNHLSGLSQQLPACVGCETILTFPDNLDSLTVDEFLKREKK